MARIEAEAGGFEPPVQLPVRQFSKLVVSATHPHFHGCVSDFASANILKLLLSTKPFTTKLFKNNLIILPIIIYK